VGARLPAGLRRAGLPLVLVLFAVYPFAAGTYFVDVGFFFGIYALLGLSLNIVLGEVGLYDLGHAGFYAIGAYVTAILNTRFGIPVLVLLPVSALAAGLFAYLVTSPVIHLRGDYLCIVTIGMGEIVRLALINNPFGLTGGPNGVYGIATPSLGFWVLDSSREHYFLVWIVVGLAILALRRLQRSRIGRAWNCIREDEVAAQATGIDVRRHKLLAFVLGAVLAGVAGNLYAGKLMVVSPESFTFWESCLMFCTSDRRHGLGPGGDHRGGGHQPVPGDFPSLRHFPDGGVRAGHDPDDDVPPRRLLAPPPRRPGGPRPVEPAVAAP
jgi:branched-chain amino acid transport system permease protein